MKAKFMAIKDKAIRSILTKMAKIAITGAVSISDSQRIRENKCHSFSLSKRKIRLKPPKLKVNQIK